jgi:hypothetical protein
MWTARVSTFQERYVEFGGENGSIGMSGNVLQLNIAGNRFYGSAVPTRWTTKSRS